MIEDLTLMKYVTDANEDKERCAAYIKRMGH